MPVLNNLVDSEINTCDATFNKLMQRGAFLCNNMLRRKLSIKHDMEPRKAPPVIVSTSMIAPRGRERDRIGIAAAL